MEQNRICSKKSCHEIGKHIDGGIIYCDKHHRFRKMRQGAKAQKKYVPSWEELELLLFIWCQNFKCPICNKKMIWWSNNKKRAKIISLQHNNDGSILLICYSCNSGHGSSQLGDRYFDLKQNEKYCSDCKRILSKKLFPKSVRSKDKLMTQCRQCMNTRNRLRQRIKRTKP